MPFFHYGRKINNSIQPTSGAYFYYDPGNTNSYNGGTTLADLSGNNNNATVFNSPIHTSGTGGYFTFDGNDDYILSPNIDNSGDERHTVEVWIYPTSTNLSIWSDLGQTTPNVSYHFAGAQIYMVGPVHQIVSALWAGTSTQRGTNYASFTSPLNKWQQVVRVYDGSKIIPYYNGIKGTEENVSFDSPTDGTGSSGTGWYLAFGSTDTTTYNSTIANQFAGRYGVIRYYKTALSDSEILQNFEADKNKYGL